MGGKETKRKVSENTQKKQYNVLSLFSSAGIGELGIKACNMNILLSNELLRNRCALYQENYPETESVCGDIWEMKNVLVKKWKSKKVGNPFLIYATPPCQGMSFNGIGKLMTAVRMGQRPKEDQRNRLIIPTIEIIKALQPKWIILENVPTMKNTIIRTESGEYVNIIDYVHKELSPNYVGEPEIVNCADYGIPQKRERLITILTCSSKGKKYFENNHTLLPQKTHSEFGSNDTLKKWVSLRESIGNLPPLSSKDFENQDKDLHWHMVPIIKKEKFWWIEHTPENETAYNNQCCSCGYEGNRRHELCTINGVHQSKKDTPIYCAKCGALLPRPTMIDKITGERRLIRGFDSAYRRMSWDYPAPTLTQNFQIESSDKKIHPSQNRVLSIYEGLLLQTILNYNYKLSINGQDISRVMCCEIIGESVPPKLIEMICKNIIEIDNH
ncbi:MAG: DNA cytosine methyltransferase [Bacteroidales bacterium]|nr:DNA cytosine methyltransferase [Bacteroidales bacterium]